MVVAVYLQKQPKTVQFERYKAQIKASGMDYQFIPTCIPVHNKKRKLSDEINDNDTKKTAMDDITGPSVGRHFVAIAHSDNVFQAEADWRAAETVLFHPVHDDLLVNVRKVEQISCAEGRYFVADNTGNYSKTLSGKVIHLWRYDKIQRKLYISRSFLFTGVEEFMAVHEVLQHI